MKASVLSDSLALLLFVWWATDIEQKVIESVVEIDAFSKKLGTLA